jgi:hypothetical protein
MTKLLGKALEELAKLSPERQEEIAAMLLDIMKHEDDDFLLTPEQEAEIRASLANPEFLSEEETAALYRRFGV